MNHCQLRNAAVRRHAAMTKHRLNPNLMTLLDGEYPFGDRSMHGKTNSDRYLVLSTDNPAFGSSCFAMSVQPVGIYGPPDNDYGTVWTLDYWQRIAEDGPSASGECIAITGNHGFYIGWIGTVSMAKRDSVQARFTQEDSTYLYVPIGPIDNKQWAHLAVTSDGATIRTFYNGKLAAARRYDRPVFSVHPNSRHKMIMGYMDEVRIMRNECAWITNFTPPAAAYTGRERYYN